jgi:hypothetical protein
MGIPLGYIFVLEINEFFARIDEIYIFGVICNFDGSISAMEGQNVFIFLSYVEVRLTKFENIKP